MKHPSIQAGMIALTGGGSRPFQNPVAPCRDPRPDRLGITGAPWDLVSAEAILRLRALHASGDWEAYWHFHLRQEHLRHYPPAA